MNLESFKDFIANLSFTEFIKLIAVYAVIFLCISGFLLYRHFDALAHVEQKMAALNKARQDIQMILTEYEYIKNKKNEVDALLAKDKNFYLQKYYQDLIQQVNINNESSSKLSTQTWPNGYIEESLQIVLSAITMQKLCEFLQKLQETPRVFVKNIDIIKGNVEKKINVNMSIATLKPVLDKATNIK
ncbi:MAG: hypothetical protein ACXWL2_00500 [Candidatus Chromulinivorax sp.]